LSRLDAAGRRRYECRVRTFAVALLVVPLAACGAYLYGYDYTPTTRYVAFAPRPVGCAFDLLTTPPGRPYVELGVLETLMGAPSASTFRASVGAQACRVGGDAVLTEVNGRGVYFRGTVMRYLDRAPDAPLAQAPAPPPTPAPPPPAGAASATVVAETAVGRSAPFDVAPVTAHLPRGQRLTVTPATNGWWVATLPDGQVGYVRAADLEVAPSPRR
jgi:hypothetical protein